MVEKGAGQRKGNTRHSEGAVRDRRIPSSRHRPSPVEQNVIFGLDPEIPSGTGILKRHLILDCPVKPDNDEREK